MLWVQVQESGLTFSGLIAPHVGGVFHTCLLGWSLLTVSAWQGAYISALSFALSSLVFLFLNLSEGEGEGGRGRGRKRERGERAKMNQNNHPQTWWIIHIAWEAFSRSSFPSPPPPPRPLPRPRPTPWNALGVVEFRGSAHLAGSVCAQISWGV